jgi:hypothetical protein
MPNDLFSAVGAPAWRGWVRQSGRGQKWRCIADGASRERVSAATRKASLEHQHADECVLDGTLDPNSCEQ